LQNIVQLAFTFGCHFYLFEREEVTPALPLITNNNHKSQLHFLRTYYPERERERVQLEKQQTVHGKTKLGNNSCSDGQNANNVFVLFPSGFIQRFGCALWQQQEQEQQRLEQRQQH